jgi:glycosyltransferase involved in cell wall biosynthesis
LPRIFVMARSVYYFTDSRDSGGAEAALLLLIEHLDRGDWRPTLLYNESPPLAPVAEAARKRGATVRAVPRISPGLDGARRMGALVRALRRERPAVFHAHLSWPLAARFELAAAVAARVPAIVATFHLFPPSSLGRLGPLEGRLLGAGVGRGIAVSQAIASSLDDVLGWPPDKLEVIHNGIAVERFGQRPDPELRRALTAGSDDLLFLTTARLDAQKGLDVLLRAARSVDGVLFAIAGGGPERARLEREADELGVRERIRFLGHRTDVPALLAVSDAFVLPSRFEGTSLALLEAMAAGKPLVTSAIPGTNELVADGETGLLVPAGDPDALAAALRRIVAEPELRTHLGAAARRRAETSYSAVSSTQRVVRVYDTLLQKRGGCG